MAERSGQKLRVLSLDGGGIRGLSSLVLLGSVMKEISRSTHGTIETLRPCSYFDLITGAGMGGVIALLLGRLKLTIPECMIEYRKLSSLILRDDNAIAPLFDTEKLLSVAKQIVAEDKSGGSLYSSDPETTKTLVYAVEKGKGPCCIRTFATERNRIDPKKTSIPKVIAALTAIRGLFDEYSLEAADGSVISFWDEPYPRGLTNPISDALEEIRNLGPVEIDVIVSIGPGQVHKGDILDLALLDYAHKSSTLISHPFTLVQSFAGTLMRPFTTAQSLIGLTNLSEDTLNFLGEKDSRTRDQLIQDGYGEKYMRFEIGPIPDVGPNDFRSVKEVCKETDLYIEGNRESLASAARRIGRYSH